MIRRLHTLWLGVGLLAVDVRGSIPSVLRSHCWIFEPFMHRRAKKAEADGNRTHQAFIANASPILKTGAVTRPANASEPGHVVTRMAMHSDTCQSLKASTAHGQTNFLFAKIQPDSLMVDRASRLRQESPSKTRVTAET